jgi:hypothetical protein
MGSGSGESICGSPPVVTAISDNSFKVTASLTYKVKFSTLQLLNSLERHLPDESSVESSPVESSLMLRPTISRPVCLGVKHPSGAYDKIFISVRQLRVC